MVSGEARGALAYNVPMSNGEIPSDPIRIRVSDYWGTPEYSAKFLEQRLAGLARRKWGHDHAVPVIQPNAYGGGVLSTAFGSTYVPEQDWTLPAIRKAEDIESLSLDVSLKDGLIPRALETIEYIVEATNGQIPVQMYNTGGPMDIATHAIDDNALLLALSLYPEVCHRVFEVCTDLYIDFMKAQQKIVPDWSPSLASDVYWPNGKGILCGEDWLAVISPKMALEFEVPYINRISDAFGGVVIHACGTLEINYQTVADHVRNLRGFWFNVGETSFPKAVDILRGTDAVLFPRWALNQHYPFESRLDFVKKVLAAKTPDMSVWLIAHQSADARLHDEDPNAVSEEILRVIHRYEETGMVE